MQQLFKQAGFSFPLHVDIPAPIRLYTINNPDGSPRWIWPSGLKQPLFLQFYNVGTFKAKIMSLFVWFIFKCGLQRLFFKSTLHTLQLGRNVLPQFDITSNNWTIFTGTPGPNNKTIVYIAGSGGGVFYKIARSTVSQSNLDHESTILEQVHNLPIRTFKVPKIVLKSGRTLGLEDLSKQQQRCHYLSDLHVKAVGEMAALTEQIVLLKDADFWKQTNQDLAFVVQKNDPRIPKGLLNKLQVLATTFDTPTVQASLCHGDFTSWNMYADAGKLSIYDWELAHEAMPIGYDLFHFIFQQKILVERASWQSILDEINKRIPVDFFGSEDQKHLHLQYYLFVHVTRYLKIYSMQSAWHVQVNWQIQTWNEAISHQLVGVVQPRKLLIADLFDFLQTAEYAALKSPNMPPQDTSEYADIDLCMDKKLSKKTHQFIDNHILTSKTNRVQKSFMNTLHIYLHDGTMLHLDLIHQFKRKHLVMLDVPTVVAGADMNLFGVKTASRQDDARYVALFYSLNKQPIPDKYSHYQPYLRPTLGSLDQHLSAAYQDANAARPFIRQHLISQSTNNGWKGLKNRVFYALDTLRELFVQRGYIITFSGVDGAGKSTVIEHLKYELEKKHRKKVIVIRHRPSILPILSAWTKGKQQAEQNAAQRLPRQGKNTSSISSLMRFAYYYSDYLFGQFYIYFRYVCTGYVVLYDRYYFDFINDAKRSNISLPKRWLRLGYKCLLEPNFNFFLYADPDTILRRKQELDRATITALTQDYIALFRQLDNGAGALYLPIENIQLKDTIQSILSKIS